MAGINALIVIEADDEEVERHRKLQLRRFYRRLRDISNPFEMPERQFLNHFRLNKEATQFLLNSVVPHLNEGRRISKIPNYLKVLCTLHFLGHGSYQSNIGNSTILGMSQASVSRCLTETCSVINRVLLNQWIRFPRDPLEIRRNQNIYFEHYGFPDTLGAIDCTHVAIVAPPHEHPVYPAPPFYNRKRYYSINVQIITDASLKIININSRYPGSVHDSAIWMMSNINTHLRNQYLNDNLSFHLIGDEGYPLVPWLMVQHPGHHDNNTPQGRFNYHLRRARTTIERVNGLLKGRYRCLLKHRTLHYDPIKAAAIIYSCATLHNLARHFNVEMPDDEDQDMEEPLPNNDGVPDENNFFIQGSRKRDRITNTFFGIN